MTNPPAPPLPDHPEPVDGYWTSRRAQKKARARTLATGTWLQRVGIAALVAVVVWFTVGDDVVGRWQQHTLRSQMAEQLQGGGSPALHAGPGDPVFGLGGGVGQPDEVTIVALPGEDVDASATAPAAEPAPRQPDAPGQAAAELSFRIRASAIGLDWVVGTGVDPADLKAGPGWMPGTAVPGTGGNTVVSGHRTTYGAPFNRIDELEPGDRITLDLPGGREAVYEVRDAFAVPPDEIAVAYPTGGSRLTLTTCTPTGSADYRLVVQAEQVAGPGADRAAADGWQPYAGHRHDDPALRR